MTLSTYDVSATGTRPAPDAAPGASAGERGNPWAGLVAPAEGGQWPRPEPVRTVEEERLHRKRKLAAAYRLFAKLGVAEGLSGHISARDPELTDHFWVNRFGLDFSRIKVSNLLLVNCNGEIVEGTPPLNPAAFNIHSQIHAARPDVVAAAHTHALYGRALAAIGEPLHPISQDSLAFYEDQVIFDEYNGVVLDKEEGRKIATALGPRKLAILRNHGLLTVGTSVEAAAYWYIAAERAARTQLVAAAAGALRILDHEIASATAGEGWGDDGARWAFEALYDLIVEEQPDLLE
ncbi:Ribulose-5-phosphate 4-epimerase/Fuculose-1-phosphate aldolase [Parafrankia irregularis]|uniref:Ribulose-5-phosphate 4-epimerase/Fuculose-1-phosphate aldolase n=1 Tax=Parafrankia irregularis TaxID=795642 RepID=A0A0S4QWZ7_9ACTN|nr:MULTISPECIES: class II aldolase/adducin family protein [Parafrankia]MBE3205805.1 class II aldolase/adducin family protein [Parafrankia sp. CH37]CUU59679.1 Ribulose-5-phosphate 4-epimerase/Fuculose-1-phosphate aldolase [Parafrankia irregularis]